MKQIFNVLLVEDDKAHAEAVKRAFLQTDSPAKVTSVFSIAEASEFLNESTPRLVITDWLLPDGKGTDLLSSDKQRHAFPLVLMTSPGNEQVAVEAIKAGALDYVIKSPAAFADMPHIATRVLREWDLRVKHKRAEEKLRESEERFRAVFEQGPLGIHIAGLDYRFVTVNAAFRQLVEYSEEELRSLTFMDITHPEDLEIDVEQAQRLLGGEIPFYKMEKRLMRKHSGAVWIDYTRSVIRNALGEPLYFLSMVEDITERKRTQDLLKRRADDLARSNEDLQQFAYVASHDLQEPLRNVATCMQMLEEGYKSKLGADADQYIHYAVEGVIRMKALIKDLLTYSRIGTRTKEPAPIDCEDLLDRSIENLRCAISETKALITHDPLPSIRGDDTQLLQVFQNLIDNAIKFRGNNPPRIHVSATKEGNEWIFSFKDNGIGIESRHLTRIFTIFQRLNKRTEYKGTGIGLAIVKKVIDGHRGKVWIESEFGAGSTFYFTLPNKE